MNILDKLELKNINFCYNNKKILEDISISINKCETVSILGDSGVGKTTLFKIILGLLEQDSGQILIDDKIIDNRIGCFGYMPQKDLLLEYKNIYDNISLPLVIKKYKASEIEKIVFEEIDKFGLKDLMYKYPSQLSGGQRQRVSFLRAYMFLSNVILLDEPFSSLDTNNKYKLYDWLKDISKKKNLSNILITHDLNEAKILSDKVYFLSGSPARIVKVSQKL